MSLFELSFPAAVTNTCPTCPPASIRACIQVSSVGPPQELFETSAPLPIAYSRARKKSLEKPLPNSLRALSGMIRTLGAIPTTPMPLLLTAPIVPATCVPWPSSSSGRLSLLTKSQPLTSSI